MCTLCGKNIIVISKIRANEASEEKIVSLYCVNANLE